MIAVALLSTLLACSSSGSDAKSSSSSKADDAAAAECPFDGGTNAQSAPGASSATLTKIAWTNSGCIDTARFDFAPAPPAIDIAYKDTNSVTSPTLLLKLKGTTLGSGVTAGDQSISGLTNVQSVSVSTSSGEVDVTIVLTGTREFLLNSSQVPPQSTLAIG